MIKIAVTGSISSGKTYVLNQFAKCGIPVFSYDKEIAELFFKDKPLIQEISESFFGVVENGRLDKKKLADIIFYNKALRLKLEEIIHPKVHMLLDNFLKKSLQKRKKMVAVEVPLLFEKKLQNQYDFIIMVSCSKYLQEKWAMQRPGMTREKLHAILKNQVPDAKKKHMVDYVIYSGLGTGVFKQVANLVRDLKK